MMKDDKSSIKLLAIQELIEKEEIYYNQKLKISAKYDVYVKSNFWLIAIVITFWYCYYKLNYSLPFLIVIFLSVTISLCIYRSVTNKGVTKAKAEEIYKENYMRKVVGNYDCFTLMNKEIILSAEFCRNKFVIAYENNGEYVIKEYPFDVSIRTDITEAWYDIRGVLYLPHTNHKEIKEAIYNYSNCLTADTFFTPNEKLLNAIKGTTKE